MTQSNRSVLRDRLTRAFPDVDFDARTFVAWVDGPTEAEVHEALGDIVNGDGTFQRTLSPEFQEELRARIAEQSGAPFRPHHFYEGGFFVEGSEERTRPGYGNEQVGQLAEQVSR